jgi:branched-chain amino acid transport system substrate-binding protein
LKAKSAGTIHDGSPYSQQLQQVFADNFKAGGGTITSQEAVQPTDTDMKPVLTRIRGQNPQVIVVWAIPPAASIVDKNYKELGLTIPLVHDSGASTWPYHDLAAGANEGAYVLAYKSMGPENLPDGDPIKPVALQLVRDAEAKYGKRYGGVEASGYDALLVAVNAIEKGGPDRGKIRDALENTRDFVGTTTIYNMSPTDHNGVNERDLVMVQIRDGKWVPVE